LISPNFVTIDAWVVEEFIRFRAQRVERPDDILGFIHHHND